MRCPELSDHSIVGRFLALTVVHGERPLFTFVGEDGRDQAALTAAQLRDRAAGVAEYLRSEAGLRPGDRVILAYPPSLDFVVGLLGAMLAELIPVPVAPPDPTDLARHLPRFAAMAASSGARAVLSNRQYMRAKALVGARDKLVGLLGRSTARWPELPWHASDSIRASKSALAHAPASPATVALLQYTSGSTSFPRGVMITHGNLAHQLACNAEELGIDAASSGVLWVPHFHDFGLISGILSVLWGNGTLTLMSPLTFLRRPDIWIDQLSQRRATHTAAPNFAYELCVRKTTPEQRARWDLSALRVAMSAAEPVRDEVVRAFCDAFAAARFQPQAFCPAYGLAEHTVGVSVAGRGRLQVDRNALEREHQLRPATATAPGTRVLVGCGRPSRGVSLRVVDPNTRHELPPGAVGELWVDSPSKAAGYWGLDEDTQHTFQARLAGPDDGRAYLRTGDLGALVDGEVYITGRRKDLLIIRGRNVYPQDLEDALRSAHAALRPGGVAAFSVDRDDGKGERLVVFAEVRERAPTRALAEEVASAVRTRLSLEHQLGCDAVVVGGAGLVLKTTSGKVRRGACRLAFLSGETAAGAHVIRERAKVADDAQALPPLCMPSTSVLTDPERRQAGALQMATPPHDRTVGLDPAFAAMIVNAARYLATPAQGEKRPEGVVARGVLRVLDSPEVPAHRFFAPGRCLPLLLRHDNRTSVDDAAPDARVAAIRVLDPDTPADFERSLLDLVLMTGRCFFHRSAEDFFRFSVAAPDAREALLQAEPHRRAAAWEGVRSGDSYTRLHYHTQTASRFVATDGSAWFARYRLRSATAAPDMGFVDAAGAPFPVAAAPRKPDDTRSPSCLRDEFSACVAATGVRYQLEVQLRPVARSVEDNDHALDCTRVWPDDQFPWRPLAWIDLDQLVAGAQASALALNPVNAPGDLGVVYARNGRESASIDHVRTILYEVAAATRLGTPLSPEISALLDRKPAGRASSKRAIAIVGAGASGLTLARALEQRGHRVSVIEREPEVGGMCQTREFDGVRCDLGGHMIFPQAYPTIVRLARELGEPLVQDFPDCLVSLQSGTEIPRVHTAAIRDAKQRVARLLGANGALKTGIQSVDRALAVPIAEWLQREDLGALWDWMGSIFVGAGYGYLDDQVPAAYLAKSFAHTGDDDARFQLANGFQRLWQRVSADLRDVRSDTTVLAAERDSSGVTLTLRGPSGVAAESFSAVVIAHNPVTALHWLDSTAEERELLGRVRTLDYVSAFLRVDGLPDGLKGRWCFVPEHTGNTEMRGRVLAFVQPDPTRNVVALIAYAAPAGVDAQALYAEDFARLGARVVGQFERRQWDYFAHFGSDDLRAGALDRLEALQGQRHTWHASTLLSFELTECAAAYAEDLAARIDAQLGGTRPPPSQHPGANANDDIECAPFAALRSAIDAEQQRILAYVRRVFAEEMELDTLPDPDERIGALGVDSLRAVAIHQRIASDSGLNLPPALFAEIGSLRTMAMWLVSQLLAPPAEAAPATDRGSPNSDAETLALLDLIANDAQELA